MPAKRGAPRGASACTVVIVDDHPLWRETLRKVLERGGARVLGEAEDGGPAVELVLRTEPDVVVMDVALPVMQGIEAARRIREQLPDAKILMLSSREDRATVLAAVRAGASGYLLKTSGAKEVADGVLRVAGGELVFPPSLGRVVLDEFRRMSDGAAGGALNSIALGGDSPVLRDGLAHVLADAGLDVVAATGDVGELEKLVSDGGPDVVILDFHGQADRGARIAEQLRALDPDVKVVVLGQTMDLAAPFQLVSESPGGVGYLLRDRVANVDELIEALRRVAGGESVVDPAVVTPLVEHPAGDGLRMLTDREREVLGLMAEGRSNQAICNHLFMSVKTLEKHVRSIFTKLGLEETPDDHRRVLAVLALLRSL